MQEPSYFIMKSICIVDNKTHVRESLIAFLEQYTDDITIVNYDNIKWLSTNSLDPKIYRSI